MSFARRIRRASGLNGSKEPRCCKMRMTRKSGYDKGTRALYICERCGKEKWVDIGERKDV